MIILSSLILLPHVKNILTEAGITGAFCVVTAVVPLSKTEEDGVQRFFRLYGQHRFVGAAKASLQMLHNIKNGGFFISCFTNCTKLRSLFILFVCYSLQALNSAPTYSRRVNKEGSRIPSKSRSFVKRCPNFRARLTLQLVT